MTGTRQTRRVYSARLEIIFGSGARQIFDIMEKPKKYKRSEIKVNRKANSIVVEVRASDATALVASLGSVIKQLSVISSVAKLFKKPDHEGALVLANKAKQGTTKHNKAKQNP
ncbi:MAG: CTAG/PCC1 family protein [Candidatus Micrarchaeaceae archaeon]